MSEERATLEIIAPTVEEALEKGLSELGLKEEDVEMEVLDEGGRGVLGIGSRQARIRLTLISEEGEPDAAPDFTPSGDEEIDNAQAIAQATVVELLEKMHVNNARVTSRISEEVGRNGAPVVLINILGDDLSILIGRKAETLNALQYITRLIVGKEVGRGVNLTLDVQGYRERRERSLRQLAQRMASQAVKSGRRQTLEPMSAYERRIVHMELQENEDVSTESVGEEPRRKVMIIPY